MCDVAVCSLGDCCVVESGDHRLPPDDAAAVSVLLTGESPLIRRPRRLPRPFFRWGTTPMFCPLALLFGLIDLPRHR